MRTQWKDVAADIAEFRRTGRLSSSCTKIVNSWIESQVSRYGIGLDREDTIQDLWVLILGESSPLRTCESVWFVIIWIRNRIFNCKRDIKARRKRRIKIERSLDDGD